VVPDSYVAYFTGAATAAGALIGLLFVAVSLRPDSIFGRTATAQGRLIASSAFTALVNAFFVAMLALIPHTNLGVAAVIVAVLSLGSTVSMHRSVKWDEPGWRLLTLSLLAYVAQIGFGVVLVVRPHASWAVNAMAYVLIAAFSAALGRAWALVQGQHLKPSDDA
jgi:hypothetical protein